jgi:hypothetical protein
MAAKVNEKALYTSENCPAVNWVIGYSSQGETRQVAGRETCCERCWPTKGVMPASTPAQGDEGTDRPQGAHDETCAPAIGQQLYGL